MDEDPDNNDDNTADEDVDPEREDLDHSPLGDIDSGNDDDPFNKRD